MINNRYICYETCKQNYPCGNTYCSANPNYIPPRPKNKTQEKKLERRCYNALHPKRKNAYIENKDK